MMYIEKRASKPNFVWKLFFVYMAMHRKNFIKKTYK